MFARHPVRMNGVCFRELIPAVPDPLATLTGLWTELIGHTDLRDDSDFFELSDCFELGEIHS